MNIDSCGIVGIDVTNYNYDSMLCGYASTITISNVTRIHEGLYTCNASQPNSNSSSDSVYVLIETLPTEGNEVTN